MRTLTRLLAIVAIMTASSIQAQESATNQAFSVNSAASWIRVLAYPDGPLKRFGHHHVISHHQISGSVAVAENPLESVITLEIGVAELVVDDAELRAQEGEDFEKDVSQKDKDGTRDNMLGEKLLHGSEYPTIRIRSTAIEGSLPDVTIVATVTVKGMDQSVRFPANVELSDDAFVARGELELTHGELGLSRFTAAGGALSVRDLLVLKYEITGGR